MELDTFIREGGFDPATITDTQRKSLTASWKRAEAGDPDEPRPTGDTSYEDKIKAIEAEADRVNYIREVSIKAMEPFARIGNDFKVKQIRAAADDAMADPKVDKRAFDLSMIRVGRADAVHAYTRSEPEATGRMIEAAVCRLAKLDKLEKYFDEQTLDASEKHFKGGLGLQDLMAHFARKNGWRGSSVKAALDSKDFFRAAFAANDVYDIRAGESGPSTYSLPNIFSNVANKFLRQGFESVESTWRAISAIRSVNDFKTNTTIALSSATIFRKLAPSGEIQHGVPSEVVYTNKADTYAIMVGIARPDLINDDLNALSKMSAEIGRGAQKKINDVFWTVFLNNSSFFTAGNANVSTGAGSAFASAGIKAADRVFRIQTNPDGTPLGAMPAILLVPPTLWYAGRELMNSSLNVGTTTSNTLLPATNIFQGAYTLLTSAYMENTLYTGNSTAAWYLLANPSDYPVIETVFVNGRDTPVVDTAEADFNQLGIQMRGYIDFGVALQEYRGGVRSAGS